MAGTLYLCATPIGNLGDASPRLAQVLAECSGVYAEDTRRAAVLLGRLGVKASVRSFFVGNEEARSAEIAERLASGETIAVITDAGTPTVADPGVSAVRAAREVGANVSVVPGPSAVTAALAVAGFGGDRFVFEGFLPRRGRGREERLAQIAIEERPVVFFSSPRRVAADLTDLATHAGPQRTVCVARELTKRFEEVWWGTVTDAATEWTDREPRGEFTVVVSPAPPRSGDLDEAVAAARRLVDEGSSRSDAARTVAKERDLPRRSIYERLTPRSGFDS